MNVVTGTVLDRDYRILELAGKGAFGVVYKAQDIHTNELIAIKQLDYSDFSESEHEAMNQELTVMPQLSHPNLVNYKRVVNNPEDQSLYIVMEYCEGGDMYDFIKLYKRKRVSIPEETIWKYLAQLTSALDYMHRPYKKGISISKRIMHRDLKPQNIMLTRTGDCKICDFNLCRPLETSRAKTLAGTLAYLAPEVCSPMGYTEKADLWSLGCILYQLCELTLPFHWTDFSDLQGGPENMQYKPINKEYSKELSDVIAALLTPDPSVRYSASDLLLHPRMQIYLHGDQPGHRDEPSTRVSPPTVCCPSEISQIMAPMPIYETVEAAPQFATPSPNKAHATAKKASLHPPAPQHEAPQRKAQHQNHGGHRPVTSASGNISGHQQVSPRSIGPGSIRNGGIIQAPPYKPPHKQ